MPLILRAVKGSKLSISEMDGNLTYLSSTLSGSTIQVTGSSIDASNTSITASFFTGDGSQLTFVTASFVTASNVFGPHGASSILSSSYALTSSYVNPLNQTVQITGSLLLSGSGFINSSSILQMPQYININGSTRRLLSGSITAVDWGFRYLQGTNGDLSVAWGSRALNKYNFGTGNSWTVVDWNNLQLNDNTELTSQISVDWGNRLLYDSTGNDSIDWENRVLKDAFANTVIEWNDTNLQPSTDDVIELGGTGNRFRSGYISRTFTVGDPSGAKTSISVFPRDGVSDYVGSITLSTGSGTPSIVGGEGQMFVGKAGANYYIYVYIGGQWRSSSLA
jgi:hypothetical protein